MSQNNQVLISVTIFLLLYALVWFWARKAMKDAEKETKKVYKNRKMW